MKEKRAVLIGATGLVGNALLRHLLSIDLYDAVFALVRRDLNCEHERLVRHIVNFNRLEDHRGLFAVDDVFCCLGTTKAKAGSREAFRIVDYDYPVRASRIARSMGARRFFIVTAIGARPDSPFFYNRVKGEVEREIASAGFEATHIFRPSLLLGERAERRPGEDFAQFMAPLMRLVMRGPLRDYLPVRAEDVARAMVRAAGGSAGGVVIHESREFH
ncbi:MAG: oxidoreductase [Spirochaetes bacterium]|nr:oxidoreductase [Spirochaetota bacterium]